MLPARKNRFGQILLFAYLRWLLRRHFHAIALLGRADLLDDDNAYPLIFFSNHHTWWDGFLEIPLIRNFRQDHFLMMEEKNLRKFSAFRVAGVFGVDLDSAAGRSAAMLYAARRLREEVPRRCLYLYPQGRLTSPYAPVRPFQGGVEILLRLAPAARAVPIAKLVTHGKHQKPEVWLEVGEPLSSGATLPELESSLETLVLGLRGRHADGSLPANPQWLQRPPRFAIGET